MPEDGSDKVVNKNHCIISMEINSKSSTEFCPYLLIISLSFCHMLGEKWNAVKILTESLRLLIAISHLNQDIK